MPSKKRNEFPVIRDLGDDLILRRSTREDVNALVRFNERIHGDMEKETLDERVGAWTRDLLERPHPTFDVGDFTLVEDKKTGEIVSCLNLIHQTWSYAGIPFGVGRPELVGTHPDYRNRGLVRAQFEVIHQWSAERGEMVQAITGIPYYYRLFGYEMALSLGGGRLGYLPLVPKLAEEERDNYQIRPAATQDIPFIDRLYRQRTQNYLVQCVWDEALWKYELNSKSPQNVNRSELRIIESVEGEKAGFFAHPIMNWGPILAVTFYELEAGISWLQPTYTLIRYLEKIGREKTSEQEGPEFGAFGFWLGTDHPVYQVVDDRLPRQREPYAWYIRVPNLTGFIRHIKPALEERLAKSPMVGYSGDLNITFDREGLHLAFESGHIKEVEPWQPKPVGHSEDAAFPGLTFLQLLFGYRNLSELRHAFADCRVDNDKACALLGVLFPKQVSDVWPVA